MDIFQLTVMDPEPPRMKSLMENVSRQLARRGLHKEHIRYRTQTRKGHATVVFKGTAEAYRQDEHRIAFVEGMALGIAEFILDHYETQMLRQIIRTEFDYVIPKDIEDILSYCTHVMNQNEEALEPDPREKRLLRVSKALKLYMEKNHALNIEGFTQFRLHGYRRELRETVEFAVDEYLMEKQYQEFISLLKYFVYIQDARIPAAHLLHKKGSEFMLLDEDWKPIETKQIEGFVVEMIDKEINVDDMIVSALISVSPQRVYIHTREPEQQMIQTIKQIFEDRAEVCTYCALCKSQSNDVVNREK